MVVHRSKIAARVLLLVLLFAVQALCHAHAIEHQFEPGQDTCVICSFGGTLDNIAMSDAVAIDHPVQPSAAPGTCNQIHARNAVAQPGARGPPSGH